MALLIDSSLWVDFTRAKSPQALKLAIQPWILDPQAAICRAVAFEVLRHATREECRWIEAQFATLPLLADPPDLWERAAELGRTCRGGGFTAGSIDLLIAATALHHGAELVSFDADHAAIARHVPLKVRLLSRDLS